MRVSPVRKRERHQFVIVVPLPLAHVVEMWDLLPHFSCDCLYCIHSFFEPLCSADDFDTSCCCESLWLLELLDWADFGGFAEFLELIVRTNGCLDPGMFCTLTSLRPLAY